MSDTQTAAVDAVDPAKQSEAAVDKTNEMSIGSPTEKPNGDVKEESEHDDEDYDRREDRREDRRHDRRHDRREDRRYNRRSNHRDYIKREDNEFEHLPESDDPVEIREQVEFYFSPQNLTTDRHMFICIGGSVNRPVEIKHITTFKRMRRFKPYSAVVKALRESKDLVVVDDGRYSGIGNEAVKRKEPIEVPVHREDDKLEPSFEEMFARYNRQSANKLEACIYAKGFGDGETSQIEIEKFFKPYGAIMVRKRIDNQTGRWKGSVFVEMDSEESQQQFLALDPKPKFDGKELLIMGKREYTEWKCEMKGITPSWKKSEGQGNRGYSRGNNRGYRGGGRGRGRGGYGDRDRRDNRNGRDRPQPGEDRDNWKDRRDRFQNNGKENREESKDHGDQNASPTKRKADHTEREEAPKKSKAIDIKEDE